MQRTSLFILFSFFFSICTYSQIVSVKSVSPKITDLQAATNPRLDKNGKDCAIIKVNIIGTKDLIFPDSVGNVNYSLGEYTVYVPEGLADFIYYNPSKKISGSINFNDYGIDIESKKVYNIIFESENHMRSAIFSIQPAQSTLTFDGASINLEESGVIAIERPIGSYPYEVHAEGYEAQSGVISLTEDNISTIVNINLQEIKYPLTINCSPSNATLFIDNVPYGTLSEILDLNVTEGYHTIRLTANGYNDYETHIDVNKEFPPLTISMEQMKEEVISFNNERTRTRVNLRTNYYMHFGGELYENDNILGKYSVTLGFSSMQHFLGIFSIKEGLNIGVGFKDDQSNESNTTHNFSSEIDKANIKLLSDYYGNEEESVSTVFAEIPIQLGFSIPFGNYNKHLFSVLAGGYGKEYFHKTEIDVAKWDYGLRVSALLDVSHFSIGGDLSKSLNDFGTFYGIRIGYKFN